MPESIFVIVLHVSAMNYSASIVLDQPKFRSFYTSETECRKDIPAARRAIAIPAIASLDWIECRKLEIKK